MEMKNKTLYIAAIALVLFSAMIFISTPVVTAVDNDVRSGGAFVVASFTPTFTTVPSPVPQATPQATAWIDPVVADELSRGIIRCYDNLVDFVLYCPGDTGDIDIYTLVNGQGTLVARIPRETLDGSQPVGEVVEEWAFGGHTWRLYHLGSGIYQVNHYIDGNLVDEAIFQ